MVWVAVFQRNLLFTSSGGTLKMEIVCFFRTVSIPSYFVSGMPTLDQGTYRIE